MSFETALSRWLRSFSRVFSGPLRHELSNGTNPGSVATSVQKLLTVFTAPTQLGHTIVPLYISLSLFTNYTHTHTPFHSSHFIPHISFLTFHSSISFLHFIPPFHSSISFLHFIPPFHSSHFIPPFHSSHFIPHISFLTFHSSISFLTFHSSHFIPHISFLHFIPHISFLTFHSSHFIPPFHSSHFSPHISFLTFHSSHFIPFHSSHFIPPFHSSHFIPHFSFLTFHSSHFIPHISFLTFHSSFSLCLHYLPVINTLGYILQFTPYIYLPAEFRNQMSWMLLRLHTHTRAHTRTHLTKMFKPPLSPATRQSGTMHCLVNNSLS